MTVWLALGAVGGVLLAVPWLLYPALIEVVASFRSPEPVPDDHRPSVTVVLATRDEPRAVRRRVTDLLRTSYPPDRLDIVVAVDWASPTPFEAYESLLVRPRVRVVRGEPPRGKAGALNRGVESATGDVLVFTDTHQRFHPDTVGELVAPLGHPRVGAVTGSYHLRERSDRPTPVGRYWAFERRLRRREARVHSPVGVTGAVSALRAELWEPLPHGLILDDVYTPMRVVMEGYRVAFAGGALAYERRRISTDAEGGRKTRTLTGNLQLCAWLPGLLVPWRNPLFLQFLCHKLLRLATPYALVLLAVAGAGILVTISPPVAWTGGVVSAVVALWIAFGRSHRARRLRDAARQIGSTQLAVVRGTWNGLRGRWDVWG